MYVYFVKKFVFYKRIYREDKFFSGFGNVYKVVLWFVYLGFGKMLFCFVFIVFLF